jgi:hypothetical protein
MLRFCSFIVSWLLQRHVVKTGGIWLDFNFMGGKRDFMHLTPVEASPSFIPAKKPFPARAFVEILKWRA